MSENHRRLNCGVDPPYIKEDLPKLNCFVFKEL